MICLGRKLNDKAELNAKSGRCEQKKNSLTFSVLQPLDLGILFAHQLVS